MMLIMTKLEDNEGNHQIFLPTDSVFTRIYKVSTVVLSRDGGDEGANLGLSL